LILREFLLHEDTGDELNVVLGAPAPAASAPADFKRAKAHAIAEFERSYLKQLLACARGNISLAARMSQKDRSALNKLVKKHGIATRLFRAQS